MRPATMLLENPRFRALTIAALAAASLTACGEPVADSQDLVQDQVDLAADDFVDTYGDEMSDAQIDAVYDAGFTLVDDGAPAELVPQMSLSPEEYKRAVLTCIDPSGPYSAYGWVAHNPCYAGHDVCTACIFPTGSRYLHVACQDLAY